LLKSSAAVYESHFVMTKYSWYSICNIILDHYEKSTIMKQLFFFAGFLILVSCSKSIEGFNGKVIHTALQNQIDIRTGETLIVNLGNFGDEEGAGIFSNPRNAKISTVIRLINTNSIIYEYIPADNFVGKDTVSLIINRGSDGAGSGVSNTARICINVTN